MKILYKNPILAISTAAGLITLAMTPWWNEDSLIIPKLIILFCIASYFIPFVITSLKIIKSNKLTLASNLVSMLMLFQIVFVLIFTNAPIEQQFYGRFGRGLGIATEISLIIFFLVMLNNMTIGKIDKIFIPLILSGLVTSVYSISQYYGYDFFNWQTRTNGIIGTLGNPNFQSSFAALTLVPTLTYFGRNKKYSYLSILSSAVLLYTIYICESTQGYIATLISVGVFTLFYFYSKNKYLFFGFLVVGITSLFLVFQGMINSGPFASVLYKYSVKSRGEMLRNSINVVQDNMWVGVGFDSLGDNYLRYKDFQTTKGVNEFTDHAHNLYVNYAAVAGLPYAVLHLIITLIVLSSFIYLIKQKSIYDSKLLALFSAWVCYQAQAMISPSNITMLVWSFIFSGAIIGIAGNCYSKSEKRLTSIDPSSSLIKSFSYFALLISVLLMWPYFNTDKNTQDALSKGDANLAITAANSFPRSVTRYERLGETLLNSGLKPQALQLAKDLVDYNPNSAFGWGLIMINDSASNNERKNAKEKLIYLDPQNSSVRNYLISE